MYKDQVVKKKNVFQNLTNRNTNKTFVRKGIDLNMT